MRKKIIIVAACLMLSSCMSMPARTGTYSSKTSASGAAAGGHAEGANSELQRCDGTLGTMVVYEDRFSDWHGEMQRSCGINSLVPVLRLFAQQSGCFVVVERGRGFDNAMEERDLYRSGESRKGSNFGKGQMVAADYTMTPTLIFQDNNTGGIGGALGGIIGGSIGAAIGGSLSFKSAQSMLTLVDNRSTVQVAVSEGSAEGMDIGAVTSLMGSKADGTLSAYTRTPEGKVIVAALMDAHNNMVVAARNYRPQGAAGSGGHGTGGRLKVDGAQSSAKPSGPDRALIKEMQACLNNLGFDVGTPDGVPGKKTTQGISSFQKISGLNVTGQLDKATIAKLRETGGE